MTERHPRYAALVFVALSVASATWTTTLLASMPHVKSAVGPCAPSYSYEGLDFPASLPLPPDTGQPHAVGLVAEESVHFGLSADAPEAHEEWMGYLPPGAGVVRLGPPTDAGMNRAFIVGMFHELHCLRYLRDEFARATSPAREREGKEPAWGHVQHCLNLLRRAALCGADTTLERADAEHDVFAQGGGDDGPAMGRVGAYHVCRDWDTVYDEMARSWIRWWEYGKEHNITGGCLYRFPGTEDPKR
ncbi:hypothetical protein EDB89DRAFT_2078934 [Lactarius sanguifluus]|nr:hypothetical protein EDB89DRAFT_2081702 [Lactarius sanguifluus]KAH9163296.1 hypothetical protein EDB89DRAFT_2078934 [Lactarius sanguifluus]